MRRARVMLTPGILGESSAPEPYRKVQAGDVPSGTGRPLPPRARSGPDTGGCRTPILGLSALLCLFPSPSTSPSGGDRSAIETTIGHYFKAGDTSSSGELR